MTWKQALRKSIDKWDEICFEGGEDNGEFDCACCQRAHEMCPLCPIGIVTGAWICNLSPYVEWRILQNSENARGEWRITTNKLNDAAINEYLFLCMLYHEYYGDA